MEQETVDQLTNGVHETNGHAETNGDIAHSNGDVANTNGDVAHTNDDVANSNGSVNGRGSQKSLSPDAIQLTQIQVINKDWNSLFCWR